MTFYLNLAVTGLLQGLLIALAALAVSLCFAVARFPNAATGDFMTLAAYAGVAGQRITGSLLAGATMAVVGVALLSLASYALVFGGVRIQPSDLWLVAIALVTLLGVLTILFLTPIGRRMRAIADNPELARASGIRIRPVMITLWMLIGVCSAIGGLMLGLRTVVVPNMGWNLLLPAFAAAVLGGVGNPAGAVLAGIGIGVIEALSTPLVGFTYQSAMAFLLLIGTLVLRPQGLLGHAEAVR